MRALLLLAPLLLVACGGGGGDAAPSASADEAAAAAIAGAATGLVDTSNLPDFVKMYDGGAPVLNMTSNEGGQRGGVFTYTVDAPVADVAGFYREQFKAVDIPVQSEMTSNGSVAIGGESEDGARSLFVTIAGGESGEPTNVSIAHERKDG